jgi:protein-tyrosine-phosphatase
MAEGWCRELKGDRFDAFSAGIEKSRRIRAARVMDEAGEDISGATPSEFQSWESSICRPW